MSRPSVISTHASQTPHGSAVGPFTQFKRTREDAGGGRLADAARAGEHERLRQASAGQRVAQRPGDRLLADDLVEGFRPPLSRDDLVTHGRATD